MSSFLPPPFSSTPPEMDGGFSPPPIGNFSPPPMSSFSPPPINGFLPPALDDGDDVLGDGDDVIGDHFGLRRHSDLSDDNNYDLTGFSEKMKTLEIDKIKHLPPREILEIQKEALGDTDDIFLSINGLDIKTEAGAPVAAKSSDPERCLTEHDIETSESGVINDEIEPENSVKNDVECSVSMNGNEGLKDELVFNGERNNSCSQNGVVKSLDPEPWIRDSSVDDGTVETFNEIDEHSENLQDELDVSSEMVNYHTKEIQENENLAKESSESSEESGGFDQATSEVSNDFAAFSTFDREDVPVKDFSAKGSNFGGLATDWSNARTEECSDDWSQYKNVEKDTNIDRNETGELKFDSDDDGGDDDFGDFGEVDEDFGDLGDGDDDFGDFGDASSPPEPPPTAVHPSNINQAELSFEMIVGKLLPKVSPVIITLYESVIVENKESSDMVEDVDQGESPDLVGRVLSDQVTWKRIEDPSSAPALDYTWLQSQTYNTLLTTLNIDTRNVLDGEGWRSSITKSAANLMTPGLLRPVAADVLSPTPSPGSSKESTENDSQKKENVQPAEFDWNNSGLVNPLDTDGLVKELDDAVSKIPPTPVDSSSIISELLSKQQNLSSVPTSSDSSVIRPAPPSERTVGNLTSSGRPKKRSKEASDVFDAFPLLDFMKSEVLIIPSKSVNRSEKKKLESKKY